MLKIKIESQDKDAGVWIDVVVNTVVGEFGVETAVIGHHERVLNGEMDPSRLLLV